MREVIIVISVLVLILGCSIYARNHIKKNSNELIDKLEKLKEGIEKAEKSDDKDKIIKEAKDICEEWERISKSWSVIVLHDELDMIETSLIRMKSKIQSEEIEQAIEELDVSIFLLKHISEKEAFNLRNIF